MFLHILYIESPHGKVANIVDYDIIVSKIELGSRYYVDYSR